VVARSCQILSRASARLFDGFEIRTEVKVIRYPDHYCDERGEYMRKVVAGVLGFDVFDQRPPPISAVPDAQGDLFGGLKEGYQIDHPRVIKLTTLGLSN
jgi:hypothetical protein